MSQNLSQCDLANILHCSRNKIQRIENQKSSMDYMEWTYFSHHFGINIADIKNGFIDAEKQNEFEAFSVPKNLQKNPFSKGRVLCLHAWNLKRKLGFNAFSEFCKEQGVDENYFVNINNSLSFEFNLRLIQFLMMSGLMKSDCDFYNFVKEIHRSSHHHYQTLDELDKKIGIEKIHYLVGQSEKYEENHRYKVEGINPKANSLTLSISPRDHVDKKLYSDVFIQAYYEKFFTHYFNQVSEAMLNVKLLENYKKTDRLFFRISTQGLL